MAEVSARETIDQTAKEILEFGRGWMASPATGARGKELGFRGMGFWVNGRAGVLGDVSDSAASSAIGFMHHDLVADHWNGRNEDLSATGAATEYQTCAAEWGRQTLADVDESRIVRLNELCRKLAAASLTSVGVLFAGSRDFAGPADDPAGVATIAMNVIREHRGGAHLTAVQAAGIGPLGSIMSNEPPRGGVPWAENFGWSGPYPDPAPTERAHAEELTSQICEPTYEALTPAERSEFIDLVREAHSKLS